MLALETGLLGTLLAVDLFLFYVFWELMLFPMYFLIGIWGHGRPIYAAVKFVLYTMIGSLPDAGRDHLPGDDVSFAQRRPHASTSRLFTTRQMTPTEARWLFAAFALAFAIKVPMWPVHTWLPDAHTNAPTAGSVILAGVMLKMGDLRLPALRDSAVPGGRDRSDAAVHGARGHRHHLWRAGRDGAAGPEAAGRVFVGQPSGLRDARNLRAQPARHRRRDLPDAQSRRFDRRRCSCWSG